MTISTLLDRPIAFHRVLVSVTGGVLPALMLSQALYWTKRTDDEDGWFWKTQAEWKEETGMSRYEQETARKKLRKLHTDLGDLWQEKRKGIPAKLFFRVDVYVLEELILAFKNAEKQHTRMVDSSNQDGDNPADYSIYTETTTETTTDYVAADADDAPAPSVEVEPEPEQKTLTEQQQWFEAICRCCGYDHRVISKKDAARVGTVASKLRKHYTLDELRYWYTSTWSRDWRAAKGRPTPEQIAETIGRMNQPEEQKQSQAERLRSMAAKVHAELEAEGIVYAK